MKNNCIFCQIASGEQKSKIIWQGSENIAFLTPYPNTPGFTVLASRNHKTSDIFDLPQDELVQMILDAKVVAGLLREKLNVARVGLIFEGYGINHAHIKLVPMHGITDTTWNQIASAKEDRKFYEKYPGFIASHDGPPMLDGLLSTIHLKILNC
jgi:histidine triad (HIT) family protein